MTKARNYRIIYYKFRNQFRQCTAIFPGKKTGKNESETSESRNQLQGNLSECSERANQNSGNGSETSEWSNQRQGNSSETSERLKKFQFFHSEPSEESQPFCNHKSKEKNTKTNRNQFKFQKWK